MTGEQLRRLREAAHISMRELASALKRPSVHSIWRHEAGEQRAIDSDEADVLKRAVVQLLQARLAAVAEILEEMNHGGTG